MVVIMGLNMVGMMQWDCDLYIALKYLVAMGFNSGLQLYTNEY